MCHSESKTKRASMSPAIFQLVIVSLYIPVAILATIIYAKLLILIARHSVGLFKGLLSSFVWLIFSCFLIAPLFYFISHDSIGPRSSLLEVAFDTVCFAIEAVPSCYYIYKYKLAELKRYGYFNGG
jgi:hypothetical protein